MKVALFSRFVRQAVLLGVVGSMGLATSASAQVVRSYAVRYATTERGGFLAIGNTLMTCPTSSSSCAGGRAGTGTGLNNNSFTMVPVDIDPAAPGTNSSSATVTIPSGSTVRFAGLYWGAISTSAARNQARMLVPGSASYATITASQLDVSGSFYQGFADVTSLVAAAGSGSYTVADVKANTGSNTMAGWGLIVVYGNPAETARNLTVFDGFANVSSGSGTLAVPVSGFLTPPSGTVNTSLGVLAFEGDLGSTGDSFQLNATTLTDARNPSANFFNSTISSLGSHFVGKSPNYVNQFGFDIDTVDASGILANSATSATIRLTTGGDQYLPGVLVFATQVYAPVLGAGAIKTVTDLNGGYVVAGDILEYMVPLSNDGDDYADSVRILDPIPSNTTYVPGSLVVTSGANAGAKTDASGDDQAEFDAGSGRVVFRLGTGANASAGGSLAPGASTGVRFRVQVDAGVPNGTLLSNQAAIEFTGRLLGTPDSADSSVAEIRLNLPDLTVTKSHSGDFVRGNSGTYQIRVTNDGWGTTSGTVSMLDTLPADLVPTSASGTGWSCSILGQSVSCTRSDGLAATGSYPDIALVVAVGQGAAGSLTNTATVSGGAQTNVANDSASDPTTIVSRADLAVTKTGPASAVPGQNLVFTVTVTNNGPSDAPLTIVQDPTPAGLTFVTNTGSCATAYPCSLGTVPAGGVRTITTTYAVPSSYASGSPILNTASVAFSGTDPTSANDSSTSSTPVVPSANLSIGKTGPVSVSPATDLVYTVTVTNAGPSDASGVTVADPTPTGLTFTSNSGSCATAYPCALGSIPAGATRTITTTYAVPPSYTTPDPILNTATVSATTSDPAAGDNSATSSTAVLLVADVAIGVSGPATVTPATTVVYTVTVTNNGPSSASAVSVALPTPPGATFVSNAGDCATAYPCALGSLASGATRTITTTFSIPSSYTTPDPVVATASVTATVSDPVPANDVASTSATVQTRADLSIDKTGPASATPGATVVYTLAIRNDGPSDALSVSVTDPTPAGLAFVSNGGDCATAFPCALGTLPVGAVRTITSTYSVPPSYAAPDPIGNTASVSSATTDPVAANDSDTVTTPLLPSADLAISKTGPASAVPGQNVVYTVTVTNNGPSDAPSVVATDPTPAGLTFVSNAGDCATAYPCALGTVPFGSTKTITTTYAVASGYTLPDPLPNTAGVSSGIADPVAGNDASTALTPVSPSADLSVVQSGPVSATAGATVAYTVTVTNNGPSDATAVTLNHPTPAGLSFSSNSGDCTSAYPCALGTIAAGATRVVTTTYTIPSGYAGANPIVSDASVSGSTPDPVAANDTTSTSTPVDFSADLVLDKSAPGGVVQGDDLTFTVVVSNDGPSDATAVSVADPVPPGLTFVSNTGDCATPYPCALGTMTAGSTRTITSTYTVPLAYTTPDPIENTATVSSTTPDPDAGNDSETTSTALTTLSSDLAILKTGPASVSPGENVVYSIVVSNTGPDAGIAVRVTDPTPSGLVFVSNTGDCTSAFPCVLGGLPVGETRTITATYSVPLDYSGPGSIDNTATVSADTGDPVAANNTSSVASVVSPSADLSLVKSGPASVVPGQSVTYSLVVTNAGPARATSVSLADSTPSGLAFVSNSGDCTTAFPCSLGSIEPGAQKTVTAVYSVPSSYSMPAPLVNSASVSSATGDPDPMNDAASASSAVAPSAALSITKTGAASVSPGEQLVYTVTVSNAGPSDAAGATVADATPAGLTFVSNAGSCATAYPCSLGAIPAGATRTITSTYSVPSGYAGASPISNTASVSSATPDPAAGDNSASASTTVAARADLSITKTGPGSATAGTLASFTVVVSNAGPATAAAVVVSDPTPAGLVFSSNSGACTTAYPCALGAVPAGATRTIVSTYLVPSTVTPGIVANTASVASSTTDPVAANDSATESVNIVTDERLTLAKYEVTDPTAPGAALAYVLTWSNATESTFNNVWVVEAYDPRTTFVEANPPADIGDNQWFIGDVAPGESGSIAITVDVDGGLADGTVLGNLATLTADSMVDVLAYEETLVSVSAPSSAGLSLAKSMSPVQSPSGAVINYILVVTNAGPATAYATTVTDVLPAGLDFLNAIPAPSSVSGSTVQWDVGDLPAGASRSFQLFTDSDADLPGGFLLENVARADGEAGPGTADTAGLHAEASVTGTVTGPGTDCSLIVKTRHVGNPVPGGQIVYRCLWCDPCVDAQGVTVEDTLPGGLELVSVNSRDSWRVEDGKVVFDLGTLPAGRAGLAYLTMKIPDDMPVQTILTNGISITDAALRQSTNASVLVVGGSGSSAGGSSSGPLLKVTGSKRAYAGSRVQYSVRFAGMTPGGSVTVVMSEGLTISSSSTPPTTSNGRVMTWDNVTSSGGFTLRGTAGIANPTARGALLSLDATVRTPDGTLYTQVMDTAVVASDGDGGGGGGSGGGGTTTGGTSRPLTVSVSGSRYVSAGLTMQLSLRYRNLPAGGDAVVALPAGLEFLSSIPAPTLVADREVTYRDLATGSGTVKIRATVSDEVAAGSDLAVGTTIVTDGAGSVGAEFLMEVR